MRAAETALTQLALDEIEFDAGSGVDILSRSEFEMACRTLRGAVTGTSVAVLEPVLAQLRRAFSRYKGPGSYDAWADAFFLPANMIRFVSVYEVKQAILRQLRTLT